MYRALVLFAALLLSLSAQAQPPAPVGGDMSNTTTKASGGGSATRTLADRANDPGFSVLEMGAKCDGVTDDTAAFTAAFATTHRRVTIPDNATCYSATGIVVPWGHQLSGLSFSGQPSPPGNGSSTILCAGSVAACVTLNDGVNGSSAGLDNISVQTNATTTMTAGKCIYVHAGNNAIIENVAAYNCYDGFYFKANPGLTAYLHNIFTGRIYDAHVVQDTWAELRIVSARFGVNGVNDVPSQTYIRVTGGNAAAIAAGPNGLHVINGQFNQGGGGAVNHVIEFVNCTAGASCNQLGGDFRIDDSWGEVVNQAIIYSDATWPLLTDVVISNSGFNGTVEKCLDLNPVTRFGFVTFSNDTFVCSDFTYAPTFSAFSNLTITNTRVVSPVTLSSAYTGSVLNITNLNASGGLTLGGTWLAITIIGGAGTLTDNSTASSKVILQNVPPLSQPHDALNAGGSIAIGQGAMGNAPASGGLNGNTVVGFNAANGALTGTFTNNTAVGKAAMGAATSGANNSAFGAGAMQVVTTGNDNTAIGNGAMSNLTNGSFNTAMGQSALKSSVGGISNTCVGSQCLQNQIGLAPGGNTSFGFNAGGSITNGSNNLALGPSVGSTTLSGGSNNILIGTTAAVDTPAGATSNYLNIANVLTATGTNTPATAAIVLNGKLTTPNLPTSCTSQPTGTLWNNSNVVNICP